MRTSASTASTMGVPSRRLWIGQWARQTGAAGSAGIVSELRSAYAAPSPWASVNLWSSQTQDGAHSSSTARTGASQARVTGSVTRSCCAEMPMPTV